MIDEVGKPVIEYSPAKLPGGVEQPLGDIATATDVGFAIGRLAIATGTGTPSRTFDGSTSLVGYAGGLTEVETSFGIALRPFADPAVGPNFEMHDFDLTANTFEATITGATRTLGLGGPGASAWVDDRIYGARNRDGTTAQAVALVSGDPIAAELDGMFKDSSEAPIGAPGGYEHLKWGFFFGDLTEEGRREHQHLGSFVAGRPITIPPIGDVNGPKGTAKYVGHAIGDVYDRGDLRTVAGTFQETFNFTSRTGGTILDFDGRSFRNVAGTKSTLAGQEYRSQVVSGDISGDLRGRFTGPMSNQAPSGLVGGFTLQNSGATPDTAYRATGVFAGEAK